MRRCAVIGGGPTGVDGYTFSGDKIATGNMWKFGTPDVWTSIAAPHYVEPWWMDWAKETDAWIVTLSSTLGIMPPEARKHIDAIVEEDFAPDASLITTLCRLDNPVGKMKNGLCGGVIATQLAIGFGYDEIHLFGIDGEKDGRLHYNSEYWKACQPPPEPSHKPYWESLKAAIESCGRRIRIVDHSDPGYGVFR